MSAGFAGPLLKLISANDPGAVLDELGPGISLLSEALLQTSADLSERRVTSAAAAALTAAAAPSGRVISSAAARGGRTLGALTAA